MHLKLILSLIGPLTFTFASTLQSTGDQTIRLSPPNSLSLANISGDDAATPLNASSNTIQVQCDGEKYGFNPNVEDCQNARSYYKRSSQLFTFGQRHSGQARNVFPLPYRLMGGMLLRVLGHLSFLLEPFFKRIRLRPSTDEALCYFEPILVDNSLGTGVASVNQFNNAAYELILQCAVRQSKGGIATGIGKSQNRRPGALRTSEA